jgi:membrane-bound lytic murein transglycosylase F
VVITGCTPTGKDNKARDGDIDSSRLISEPIDFDWEAIKKRGTLKVLIENSSTSYFLYKGQPKGYEYELINMMAHDLGLRAVMIVENDLSKAFERLNRGDGDIVAANLTVTKQRQQYVSFTHYHALVRQVLIQRKPDGWRSMKKHEIEKELIRNPIDLIGKEIVVRKGSSFITRLHSLSDEIGGDILISEDFGDVQTEELIEKVAQGDIDFTVADENIADINAVYYPNVDAKTPISLAQQISWAVRKNSPAFLKVVNDWIDSKRNTLAYNYTYRKYYHPEEAFTRKFKSFSALIRSGAISPYDSLIKQAAEKVNWDWRLLTAMIFQESKFDPNAKSWAGARGLMQMLPANVEPEKRKHLFEPDRNIEWGSNHILWLQKYWRKELNDTTDLQKFVLGSYNVGHGHVQDARRLARKQNLNPDRWDENVERTLLLKSNPKYYLDPVVRFGYCRGREPVNYVKEILERYQQYSNLIVQ